MVGIVDFFEKTNPITCAVFLDLFKKVYNEECHVGTLEESSILCEFCMLISTTSKLNIKWKHTFLYSGESDLRLESLKMNMIVSYVWKEIIKML